MNNQELADYRLKLHADAMDPNKKPDRIPHMSFFVTWKILDSGYKLTEAMSDWDVMEKVMRQFQERYNFDSHIEFGNRNNYLTSKILGESRYYINDEEGSVNYKDFAMCETDELIEYAKDPFKFRWTKGMAKKYSWWREDQVDIDMLNAAYKANTDYMMFMGYDMKGRMPKILHDEYGIPYYSESKGFCMAPIETLFNHLRGIKGLSIDLRRHADIVRECLHIMDEDPAMGFNANIERMRNNPAPASDCAVYDYDNTLLAHSILNPKQWEEFYWPYLKPVLETCKEHGWRCRLFTEASSGRFFDYFNELPEGTFALHLENDDIFEAHRKMPRQCMVGGMTTLMLGSATPQQCVDHAKKLIDEVGEDGNFILCQDKMASYRNDCTRENLEAVCNFVQNYRS